ncbi:MAG: DUF2281 domain-containing protein [Gammaproteobacteria bacterium]|nr:DUF2281 domain-containing protein [Gammaproteobacteria bacterium]
MNIIEQINQETGWLPAEAQAEVLDFVRFLHTKFRPRPMRENDEVSRLLREPLRIKDARPLNREEIYAR